MRVFIFNALLFLALIPYVSWRGGASERIATAIVAIGSVLTFIVIRTRPFAAGGVAYGIATIDLIALCAFVALAHWSARRWTIWLAATHALAVLVHFAKWSDPGILKWVYQIFIYGPAWGMLALIAVGTWRYHRRQGLYAADPSWRT